MPRYNTFRYGRIAKYGRYDLQTSHGKAIGPYVRYRMRVVDAQGNPGEYVTMARERVDVPADQTFDRVRIRVNDGAWVYMQTDEINNEVYKVRIRSLDSGGGYSQWLYGERANLTQI